MREAHLFLPAEPGVIREGEWKRLHQFGRIDELPGSFRSL